MCYFTGYNSDLNRVLLFDGICFSLLNILFNDVRKWKRLHFVVKKNEINSVWLIWIAKAGFGALLKELCATVETWFKNHKTYEN